MTVDRAVQMTSRVSNNWWMLFIVMLAWMADASDSLMYSFAIGSIANEWKITPAEAALIGFLPLGAAALGGPLFGYIADKFGRKNSLLSTMLLVGISSLAVSVAQNPTQMVLARILVGLVLGGVWTTGMTLISESWNPKTRGKAVALVQVGFPLGYLYASLCAYFLAPSYGWRGSYVACAVLAFVLMFLIKLGVEESPVWLKARSRGGAIQKEAAVPLRQLFTEGYGKRIIVASLIAFLGIYGYWGVMTWIPSYLASVGFKANQIPLWTFYILSSSVIGYLVFGVVSDRFGRRKAFAWFFVGEMVLSLIFGFLPVYLSKTYDAHTVQTSILLVGPVLSFFTGYFSGYGAYYSELFPTRIRASAAGFCFNIGRIGTAVGPGIIGTIAASYGLGGALSSTALAFLVCVGLIFLLPETVGAILEDEVMTVSH